MGSGSEALGWRNGFRAFHRAKMSSQDTQVNTVDCIFLPKKIKYLKTLYLHRVARTCIFAVQMQCRCSAYCAQNACYCYLLFISSVTKL